jgi:hypothetical protein
VIRWDPLIEAVRALRPGRIVGAEPLDEAEHFFACEHCGQAVDMRVLADVLYHDTEKHEPILTH